MCRCQPYSVHINMDTFEEVLAQKRAKDEVRHHMCRLDLSSLAGVAALAVFG